MAEALEGPLTPIQQRVLGALAEKAATVPDTYPMTLRGLQTACNQKNNREPVTEHTEGEIQAALDELKARHLVRFVYASHGARSTKFRHVLDERLDLDASELALVTALLLRGPQTLNELRTRTERAHAFGSNDEVAATLEGLAARTDPLVVQLARQPGQKEARWAHLLGDGPDERIDGHPSDVPAPIPTGVTSPPAGLDARVAELEQRVTALEALLTDPTDPDPTTEETSPT
jgi:hypothetical protein